MSSRRKVERIAALCSLGLLLIVATLLVSCGSSYHTPPSGPTVPWAVKVGEVRTFTNERSAVDANGNALSTRTSGTTTFTTKPAVSFGCVTAYEIEITKDCLECYWGPGYDRQDHFFVYSLPDGTITSPGEIHANRADDSPIDTVNFRNLGSVQTYSLLTPGIQAGQSIRALSRYVTSPGADFSCIPTYPASDVRSTWGVMWKTDYSFGQVTTPAYSGPVVIARYAEGNAAGFPNVDPRCTGSGWPLDASVPCDENDAESWYFALNPPYGLVQVVDHHLSVLDRFMDGRTDLQGHEETLVLKLTSVK